MSSDAKNFGFAQFVPGFDFLQNLAKGASEAMPQMPGLANWVAPTLNVEELDKRINELRAVQFWLEQNGRALSATIQALEVQKMTLATLQGMDVTLADLAESLKVKPAASATEPPAAGAAPAVDPVQWWSSLTQQFQQIAASAMQQAAQAKPMQTPPPAAPKAAKAKAAAGKAAPAPRKRAAPRPRRDPA